MEDFNRLKRITSVTGIVVSLVIAVTIPIVFFSASYHYQSLWLKTQTDVAADDISELIYKHPDTWNFQIVRIDDILERLTRHNNIHYELLDNSGETIVASGDQIDGLTQQSKAGLHDGANRVGIVVATISLDVILTRTFYMFLVGFFIATITYLVLRLLPFAALDKVTSSLVISRKKLREQVSATETAFRQQEKLAKEMRYQAYHDALTNLPNRKYFYQQLNETLSTYDSSLGPLWVIILDLDRFKEINDALGHHLGDEVLITVAKRLTRVATKQIMVARLGGDEFAILMRYSTQQQLEDYLHRVEKQLAKHIIIEDLHLAAYPSLGIAQCPKHGETQMDLLRHADIAMYQSKRSGEPWEYYDESQSKNTPNRLALVSELRQALDNRNLEMHYQPKIDLASGNVIGFEALARWIHPELGFVSPDVFVAMAEQTNMIHDLTQWALESSLAQLKKWHSTHNENWTVAVNISARNLQNESLSTSIEALLNTYNLTPNCLILEITETSIMNDPEHSQKIVRRLADMGIKIAIDDFGTGYSSLAYLKKLAAHELKIDRSFVMNLLTDYDDKIIVDSTIKLAHDLELKVVAEGIESEEVRITLKEAGCEYAQGYHICKPNSPEHITSWLDNINNNSKS